MLSPLRWARLLLAAWGGASLLLTRGWMGFARFLRVAASVVCPRYALMMVRSIRHSSFFSMGESWDVMPSYTLAAWLFASSSAFAARSVNAILRDRPSVFPLRFTSQPCAHRDDTWRDTSVTSRLVRCASACTWIPSAGSMASMRMISSMDSPRVRPWLSAALPLRLRARRQMASRENSSVKSSILNTFYYIGSKELVRFSRDVCSLFAGRVVPLLRQAEAGYSHVGRSCWANGKKARTSPWGSTRLLFTCR